MTFIWILLVGHIGVILASSNRIVGGNPTTIESYPSIVQVEFLRQVSNIWSQNCAANILTNRFLLSAAQCFSGWNFQNPFRRIRAGATHRQFGGVIIYVERAINHPLYGTNGLEWDICVLRLTHPLIYSSSIANTTIVTASSIIPDNVAVIFAGWGRIAPDGPHSDVLRDVMVYTINNRICAERYSQLSIPIQVTENMICAGILDIGGRDACHDDTGGPMLIGHVTIGIISGGYSCADGTYPGISTAVAPFTQWIVDTVDRERQLSN